MAFYLAILKINAFNKRSFFEHNMARSLRCKLASMVKITVQMGRLNTEVQLRRDSRGCHIQKLFLDSRGGGDVLSFEVPAEGKRRALRSALECSGGASRASPGSCGSQAGGPGGVYSKLREKNISCAKPL